MFLTLVLNNPIETLDGARLDTGEPLPDPLTLSEVEILISDPGSPGHLSGPPEDCYPPEDPEWSSEDLDGLLKARSWPLADEAASLIWTYEEVGDELRAQVHRAVCEIVEDSLDY